MLIKSSVAMESMAVHEGNQSFPQDQLSLNNSSSLSAGLIHLPPSFVDAIIPGYSVLASTLLSQFGIDLSFYVSLIALFFVASTALQVTVIPAIDRVFRLLTSTVVVDEYDAIFDHIAEWLTSQKSPQNHRILRAHTGGRCEDEDEDDLNFTSTTPGNSNFIFNFNDFATRVAAKYEPHSTTGFFRHKGHIFRITREAERVQNEWSDAVRDREKFIITVVWRSTSPIKALIEEARELSFSKRTSSTVIFRPTPKPQRGHGNEWQAVTTRPSRSMDTVVLDDEQKYDCLSDINEFLQAARWYSNRGIPYRRGYLFHGLPGWGKTSLSFALAGVFGLEIYCLSLTEATLTEEDLIMLFTALPQRCIVLLEDIDCAGVSRPRPAAEPKKSKRKAKSKKPSRSDDSEATPTKLTNAITISGLLNAIDGVATAEGRILIMTTNYPDKLDAALTRPGRIDMRVELKLASKQQIKELFLRMYSADTEESNKQPTRLSQIVSQKEVPRGRGSLRLAVGRKKETAEAIALEAVVETETPGFEPRERHAILTPASSSPASQTGSPCPENDDVEDLAILFSAALPDHTFSPAEIQGFLLMHKKSPLKAVRNVAVWRDEEISKKDGKKLKASEESKAEPAKLEKQDDLTDAIEIEKPSVEEIKSKDVDAGTDAKKTGKTNKRSKKKRESGSTSDSGSGSDSDDGSDSSGTESSASSE